MDKLEYFQKIQEHELDRKDKIAGRYPLIIAIYPLIGAGIKYNLDFISDNKSSNVYLAQWDWIFISLAIFTFFISLYYFIRCVFGYAFNHIPYPCELLSVWDRMEAYYLQYPSSGNAKDEIEKKMINMYCEMADYNFRTNNTKHKNFYNTLMFQVLSVSAVILGICLQYFHKIIP